MFSTQEAFIENVATAVPIAIVILFLGRVVISIGVKLLLFLRRVLPTMFSTQEAFRENGATAVSIVFIAIALLFLGLVVIPMLSLEAELLAVSLLWGVQYCLQRVLVGKRRCSGHNWYVQYPAMAAYYLPTTLAFYAARSLYQSASHINESTPLLVFCILVMLEYTLLFSAQMGGILTNMRIYSLGNRPQDRCNFLMWLVFLFCMDWKWTRISSSKLRVPNVLVHISLVCFMAGILFIKPPESNLDCRTKEVADYMKRRKSSKSSSTSSPFFDANSNNSLQLLDCCRYPFVIGRREWITVQDLFDQCDDLSDRDKEICLSYSLSRLLARRYYGFHCAEEGDDIVRRFVLADLGKRDGYDRAFRIVEVQLAFLHDYFFTASLPIIELGLEYIGLAQNFVHSSALVILAVLISVITTITIGTELEPTFQKIATPVMSLFWTSCVIFPMPTSFLVQNILASYWRPIHTAFHKLHCLSYTEIPLGTLNLVRLLKTIFCSSLVPNAQDVFDLFQTQAGGVEWSNRIGQYSILKDFNRHRSLKKEIVAWFKGTILSEPSYRFIKHLPVEDEEVNIKNLDSMRKLVADTLRAIDGPPTNGSRSIKINRDSAGYDWSWTCRQQTHTHTILIWHIATCYCDQLEEFPLMPDTLTFHKVATALSRYCAYLVAFLPEFLPEHSLITKQVFQRVLQEAKGALGSMHMEEREKYTKIRKLELPPPDKHTNFHKGVRLGRQLEELETRLRWKVMAEFWAETILYIAPSDNAEAHIEHLAKGGEFITHLWAMLSNAGILKRATGEWHPPPTTTTTGELCSSSRGPLTKTQITDVQTQGSIVPSNDEVPARSAPSTFSTPSSQRGQPPKYTEEEKGKLPEI